MEPFFPGRYAAIDVGSHTVLFLIAEVDEEGRLTPLAEGARNTRLSERFYQAGRLSQAARERTAEAICEFTRMARRANVEGIAAVGTSVLREAANTPEFSAEVRERCGVPIEVISGEREAELAYQGNLHDRRLPAADGERVVIDIGGGSTELVRGVGGGIRERHSYPLGAVRLTETHFRSDPPGIQEIAQVETVIEEALATLDPMAPASMLLGSGGTLVNLARVAKGAGMIHADPLHGAVLPHTRVAELIDLFRSLPLAFRRRISGLEPDRADVILAGAMILHQLMARLSAPSVVVTENGVRHGCVYAMAGGSLLRR